MPSLEQTKSCVVAQLAYVGDNTSKSEIETILNKVLKEQKENHGSVGHNGKGPTAIFTIIRDSDDKLRVVLEELGFRQLMEFPRRNGYSEGTMEMWGWSYKKHS